MLSSRARSVLKLACSVRYSRLKVSSFPAFGMPATLPLAQPSSQRAASYRNGPDSSVQIPQLPKQLDGKFVRGQMYTNQDSLPKLPVPPLNQTLAKYIKGIQYLVSSEELEKTKKVVAEFGKPGGVGEQLQKKLLERAEAKENWLIDWWNVAAYLGFREPVVVHSSPAVGFPPQSHGNWDIYTKMATRMIIAIIKWNMLIQSHALPPDVYRETPLCMAQHDLYSKTRIPAEGVDLVRQTPFPQSRHIIVTRNNHFYKLDVLYECPDGTLTLAPPNHIVEQLLAILQTSPETCEHPVGILTSEHRDTWYRARQELLLDPINRSSLDAIETAQGVFCLDKTVQPNESNETYRNVRYWDEHKTMLSNRYLHGNGAQHGCNRWFDTSIQVMLGEDGGVGSNLEHSAADGVAAITVDLFALDLQEMCDVLTESSPVPHNSLRPFQPLDWNISLRSARDIQIAKENLDKLAGDVDLNVFTFTEFGKELPKSAKLSPDGFVQNAILLTYYRMYNKMAPMYESGGTRKYRLGRTETIRNTTSEANAFIQAMQSPSAPNSEKAMALQAAVKAHSQATNEALDGQAFDRHLLGLRTLARESGMDMPDIFTDPSYGETLQFRLSTSQVPVPNYEMFLCFGAVVPDGYGVCYNPQEKQIIFSVSCFHSCPETSSILFLKNLTKNLIEMGQVLTDTKRVSAKL